MKQTKIPEETIKDESGNTNKETEIEVGIVDFIKPKVELVKKEINKDYKQEIITFKVTDKYFSVSKLTVGDIKIYLDEEEATEELNKKLETTDIADETGKTFKLTISGFEQSSKKAGRKYNNWSGTTKIVIPEGMFEDKTGNQNDDGYRKALK